MLFKFSHKFYIRGKHLREFSQVRDLQTDKLASVPISLLNLFYMIWKIQCRIEVVN